jgi:hypothetical protein
MMGSELMRLPDGPEPGALPEAYAWAGREIEEWLTEADEEAAAIIERARAEALRLELSGHEELERLREEAVRVRMATAERVARQLGSAREEAEQVLARAGTEAEMMMNRSRSVIGQLVTQIEDLRRQLGSGSASDDPAAQALATAAAHLQGLAAQALGPARWTEAVVLDDTGDMAGTGAINDSSGPEGAEDTEMVERLGPDRRVPAGTREPEDTEEPVDAEWRDAGAQDDIVPAYPAGSSWRRWLSRLVHPVA